MVVKRRSEGSPLEIELKFALVPRSIPKIRSHPLLASIQPTIKPLVSIYFDTDAYAFRDAGMSLRVRASGDRVTQTLKRQTSPSNGLFVRSEHETELARAEPNLGRVRRYCPTSLRRKLRDPLKPVFRVEVRRTEWSLRWKDSTINVALDEGNILNGAKGEPIHELEVELREGEVEAAFAVARDIANIAPLRLEVETKPDRGYRLIRGKLAPPEKTRAVRLGRNVTTAAGFRAIASHCIHDFATNSALLPAACDPELVHRMRVALRQLRSLMSFSRALFSKRESARFRIAIENVAKRLGAARDLDILLAALKERNEEGHSDATLASIRQERDDAYSKLTIMLRSRRFCACMLDFLAFVECGFWLKTENPERQAFGAGKLEVTAIRILHRQWRKLREFARVSHLDAKKRHRLRIRAKKLRYACEFFGDLFDKGKRCQYRVAFLDSVKELQDTLGQLNDRASMRALLDRRAGTKGKEPDRIGWKDCGSKHALMDAAKIAQMRLNVRKPFWT
jgi:triphosphatase